MLFIYLFHIGEQHEQSACLSVPKVKKVYRETEGKKSVMGMVRGQVALYSLYNSHFTFEDIKDTERL